MEEMNHEKYAVVDLSFVSWWGMCVILGDFLLQWLVACQLTFPEVNRCVGIVAGSSDNQ